MQTRTYKDLFRLITSMIGTGGELPGSGTEDTQVADFINRRFQQAFDQSPVWPRYVVVSEPRELIALTITGASGTGSTDVNGNYILLGSQKSGGSGHAKTGSLIYCRNTRSDDGSGGVISPVALIYEKPDGSWNITTGSGDVTYSADSNFDVRNPGTIRYTEYDSVAKSFPYEVETWAVSNGADVYPNIVQKQSIPYSGGSARGESTTIGDFQRIHRKKAFINNSSTEYDFSVDFEGANILNTVTSDEKIAYVTYKQQFTPFTVTSDYYNSVVEVPGEFFNYIAHAVYADFLRVQNRQQEAIAEEQVAQTYLALELEKIDIRSNNNTVNKRFSTYVNRQSR